MHTRFAPADVCSVHQVVMQQCEIVIDLQAQSHRHDAVHILSVHIVGHEHQNRTNALSAQG